MFKKAVTRLILLASVILLITPAYADTVPTIHQVYEATKAGKLNEAERMMDLVLKAHPDSAKAHLIDAEILTKEGQMARAQSELNTAEKIAPGLPFVKPAAINELQAKIAAGISAPVAASNAIAKSPRPRFPWGMMFFGLIAIGGIYLVIRAISSRNGNNRSSVPGRYYPSTGMPGGSAPPYGGAPIMPGGGMMGGGMSGGGMGSGIVSGLATGAAVGAGMVAGEELAHHFLDGGQSNTAPDTDNWNSSPADDNMGGTDFGINDNSSWDDNTNISDNSFGGGGDDWS
ncbi:MAG: hypothetical protein ACYCSS_04075 [Sulfuriferula sp.]